METPPSVPAPAGASLAGNQRRVTLRDIARQLGVSHVTVSYALRGIPRVSGEVRDRVRAEAEKMGYRPDPMLQALSIYRRTARTPQIQAALAWLSCWDPPEEMHTRREFHAYWQGVRSVAEHHGYRLEQFSPSKDMSLQRIQQILLARSIRGVLVSPPQSTFSLRLETCNWARFAVVKFGHAHPGLHANIVTSAHVYNATLALQSITARGYRRVGFVTSDYSLRHTQFLAGVLRAQQELPTAARVPYLSLSEPEVVEQDGRRLKAWLARAKPDAVLTNMREVPAMVRALGLRIPQDIALAALSVHDGNADAGIDQNPLEIGRAACESVVALMLHGSFGLPTHPRELLIEGTWVDGSMLPRRA